MGGTLQEAVTGKQVQVFRTLRLSAGRSGTLSVTRLLIDDPDGLQQRVKHM